MGKNNSDVKLNKTLKITFILFLISVSIAIGTILNKGVILGKRLIDITEGASAEPVHVIQVVSTNNYLKNVGDTVELKLSIDGKDVAGRRRL